MLINVNYIYIIYTKQKRREYKLCPLLGFASEFIRIMGPTGPMVDLRMTPPANHEEKSGDKYPNS